MSEKARASASKAAAPRALVTIIISSLAVSAAIIAYGGLPLFRGETHVFRNNHLEQERLQTVLQRCETLRIKPDGLMPNFTETHTSNRVHHREIVKSIVISNATIFTGIKDGNIVRGEILLENGVVRAIGQHVPRDLVQAGHASVVDAQGAWVTPGLGVSVFFGNILSFNLGSLHTSS
ncbi:hypothetical protein E1B28_004178 [Marasmius oreades]|uniref:Uncharacterized protein n=1 Tax=Marasmius oreades TaxID=181124 RepID=A0A9P7UY26_9AGAR|nr:uncharacterized protein E1B28_004178 [Marasmius oreades]KAG7096767.1 hypothetical protein E1B28_004178 [Marasmius oreades]